MNEPKTTIARFIRASRCSSRTKSPCAVAEIVEQRHAVGLCPDAYLASILERVVIPFERGLAVVRDGEVTSLKVRAQGMPDAGRDFHVRALLFGAPAVDGVVDRDVIFKRVGASDVVI